MTQQNNWEDEIKIITAGFLEKGFARDGLNEVLIREITTLAQSEYNRGLTEQLEYDRDVMEESYEKGRRNVIEKYKKDYESLKDKENKV